MEDKYSPKGSGEPDHLELVELKEQEGHSFHSLAAQEWKERQEQKLPIRVRRLPKRKDRSTPRIVLTGGGTTGHVAVNLGLIPKLQELGWEIFYLGSKKGIERSLIASLPGVTYIPIATGKLRRYLSFENIKDSGRVVKGLYDALRILRRIRPDVVFSKGGYVSVPVVMAASLLHIPALAHESDLTPGLANRLCMPYVKEMFFTFEKSLQYVKKKHKRKNKAVWLGPVIRNQMKKGEREHGLERFGFSGKKPILVAMGGSLGAAALNQCIWENLDVLLDTFDILHGVGKGKNDPTQVREGYHQVEYISDGMADVLAMADVIVSRAGSNAIFEFLYYHKPMLLIPLPRTQSRGDQILNAREFEKKGYAKVLEEETMTKEEFLRTVQDLYVNREQYAEAQKTFPFEDAEGKIIERLQYWAHRS